MPDSLVTLNVFNKHHHDCRYFTKNQLKYPNAGGEVNWFNITSLTPAMSAVYYSQITAEDCEAITTTRLNPANGINPFATMADVEAATAAAITGGAPVQISFFEASTPYKSLEMRLSGNIYDTYYASQGNMPTKDWSPIKHHLEYLTHRRNPYYAIQGFDSTDSEVNWIDEDIDGNKVWIGERQIFTGGVDGINFRSGAWSKDRAIAIDGVSGMPQISDLYNNVTNSEREDAFANRQIIVYGGVEIGRNLTLLSPVNGTQTLSASGAHAYFDDLTIFGDFNYEGSISNINGSFEIDAVTGNISSKGNLVIGNTAVIRKSFQILDILGTSTLFNVDTTSISGTQSLINLGNFSCINGNIVHTGNLSSGGNATINGNLIVSGLGIGGSNYLADDTVLAGNVTVGEKIVVGGSGQVSTFNSGIRSDGVGLFFGGLPSANTYNYKGFFGGDVLISGGLTIQDYFKITDDLDITGDLTIGGSGHLKNNVTASTDSGSRFIVGQPNPMVRAGDAYVVNWTNTYNKVSTFRVFTREIGTSANILTMRMAEDNIFNSGYTVGPSGVPQLGTERYTWWNGVDPRVTNNTYKNDASWSGIEVMSYLKSTDDTYNNSQYLLFTSNPFGFSHQGKNGNFPGSPNTESFPNGSENFGWVFSDWFRTETEKSNTTNNPNGIKFPLHLIASKDYVDYRMQQLHVAGSAFKVSLENIIAGSGDTPEINDVIFWDGSKWSVDKLNINSQLWQRQDMIATGSNITTPTVLNNTIFVITNENCDSSFNITLPAQKDSDVGLELVFKFLDVPAQYFPITINAHAADTIDGTTVPYKVNVAGSAIRLYINQYHSWIVI